MASLPEEYLSCPICQEVFKDPVLLSCSHSFCGLCLRSWWSEKPTHECPVCKRRSSRTEPPSNLVLRNLCEVYLQQREQKAPEEHVCPLHSETFKLFCLSDQQPVCVVCRDSKAHEDHRFRPIVEAAQDLREELEESLNPLRDRLERAERQKEDDKSTLAGIKTQSDCTANLIEKQFLKLHNFLSEQQEVRLKALREEEEQKTQRMKDKTVSKEIEALSGTIRATEEQLKATDLSFLLKYKAAVERVQRCPLLEGPGALIDQAKHLGNLAFNIWSDMKSLVQYSPVILDPNTAVSAVLSEDLTSFTFDKKRKHKETPKNSSGLVLGSEGFDSGSHSWDVEVGKNKVWGLGVVAYSFDEWVKGNGGMEEIWAIVSTSNGKYKAMKKDGDVASLKLESSPERIRVCLDCDKHEVSFYEADTDALIHSFTHISFLKYFPYFYTRSSCSVRILPEQILLGE
ncbi:E3 ubiquitin-protein ligase TRIM35-like [Eucyclogobius newberryi]|uniref:E3 ubiquitin-protein ligase TRIM35-like n=1 Tax=Eucyclogobius newberryi TaxID=166745 RepID=UPI003B5C9AF4